MAEEGKRTLTRQASKRKPRKPKARCVRCGKLCRRNRLHCRACKPDEKPQFRPSKRKLLKPAPASYRDRDLILAELGFSSYRDYLDSDLWRKIRSRFLWWNRKCFRCGEPSEQVHHRFYSKANLSGEKTSGLHGICRVCHELLEFDAEGNKLPLHLTAKQTLEVMKGNKRRGDPAKHQQRLRVRIAADNYQAEPEKVCAAEKCQRPAKKGREHCPACLIRIRQLLEFDPLERRYSRR